MTSERIVRTKASGPFAGHWVLKQDAVWSEGSTVQHPEQLMAAGPFETRQEAIAERDRLGIKPLKTGDQP